MKVVSMGTSDRFAQARARLLVRCWPWWEQRRSSGRQPGACAPSTLRSTTASTISLGAPSGGEESFHGKACRLLLAQLPSRASSNSCGAPNARLIEEAVQVLQKASAEVEDKVRRSVVEHDAAAKKRAENAQRSQVLAQIKGDKEERQVNVNQ